MTPNRHVSEFIPVTSLITLAELATALRVSQTTARRWWKAGFIPAPSRLSSRVVRWDAEAVNAWIDSQNERTRQYG